MTKCEECGHNKGEHTSYKYACEHINTKAEEIQTLQPGCDCSMFDDSRRTQVNSYACQRCGNIEPEEVGSYPGWTCDDCQEEIETNIKSARLAAE